MQVLFRAKEKNSNNYVIGYEYYNHVEDEYYITHYVSGSNYKVDRTTRSINIEDMLDSQGNKIFASLSEDGKGGDIVKYEQVLGGILKLSGPKECIVKYCNRDHVIAPFFINAKYKNQKTYMTKEHLQVIGIQK